MEMDILEKCAYIKGLAEGLNIDNSKPEGKVLNAIIDLLSDITATIADMDDEVATLGDYIEEIDHDLGDVEEYLYEDECDCDCCDCEDEDFMEAMCPHCKETICFDNEIDPEDLICPACGKAFSEEKQLKHQKDSKMESFFM